MNKLLEEQAKLQDAIDAKGGWELERKLEVAADALRLPPWDADVTKISGGERRRVALCRLLLSQPDMLLLDEPTNHLDAESVAWLERFLESYPGTVIAVTHDRYFLDNVAGWILELDRGHGIPWEGNYSSWLDQKETRLAIEEKQQEGAAQDAAARARVGARRIRRRARRRARRACSATRSWPRRNSRSATRRTRSTFRRARASASSSSRRKGLTKGFGDRLLFDNLNFNLPAGGIVGVIGPNGAGKTTLFRMITGQEKPDGGEIRIGPSVQLAYVDQSRQSLDDAKTVWQEISGGLDMIKVGNYETSSRGYVGRFNFRGTQQQQLIGELSGGERNRVHLAKVLKSGGNVLLLDEPTNDLDVETLRALEEALLELPGLRGRDLARSLVPRPHRDAHPRVRGQQRGRLVRGQLRRVRRGLQAPQGRGADSPHRIRYRKLDA